MWKTVLCLIAMWGLYGGNQTSYVTYPLPEDSLPFRLEIKQAPFSLPMGLQAYASGRYKDEWVLLAGRTAGLHGFSGDTFPVATQNTTVFVLNLKTGLSASRSLADPSSHLTQEQVDQLSGSNPFSFQGDGSPTLYLIGGHGMNRTTGRRETFPVLTAIDLPQLIQWVKQAPKCKSVAKCIRQVSHPLLQVTGGVMWQDNPHQPTLLCFGQNFIGDYVDISSTGVYTHQIRPFQVMDTGKELLVYPYPQPFPNPIYRRRDLNIVPAMRKTGSSLEHYLVAFGGVFTPGMNFGAWTIPIEIFNDGSSKTLGPSFAQGMNNYACPTLGLYSEKTASMYTVFFGGLSYLYSLNRTSFCEDPGIGFTNDVTTIQIDSAGRYQQYFMSATYPSIATTFGSCPSPTTSPATCTSVTLEASPILLFGTSAQFLGVPQLPYYPNSVLALDKLGSSTLLGYIVGGIKSSAVETCSDTGNVDTLPSEYIFSVTLTRNGD